MTTPSILRRYAVVSLHAGLLFACGSEYDGDLGDPPLFPIPGCEQFDPHPCDAREGDCQLRLFEIAACLRGDESGEPPPVTVISSDEYVERLRAAYADEPDEETALLEHTLVLFGLGAEDSFSEEQSIERARKFVGGLYASEEEGILLIDDDAQFDSPGFDGLLVHEFAHALQDRTVGLDAYYEAYASTYDSQLAVAAMIEGEADLIRYRYLASALGLEPAEIDLSRVFDSRVAMKWDEVSIEAEGLASSRMLFSYAFGARYLNHAFQTGGTRAVADVWASPPTTTQAFFASEDGVVAPDFEPAQFDTFVAAGGVNPTYELTLGAWGLFVLLAKHGATFETANEGAQAWRGDRYYSYEVDEAAAAIWRIELADATIAETVVSQLRSPKLRAQAIGTTITLGVGDPALPIDWAFDQ